MRYHVKNRPNEPRYYVEAVLDGPYWTLTDWQGEVTTQGQMVFAEFYEEAPMPPFEEDATPPRENDRTTTPMT